MNARKVIDQTGTALLAIQWLLLFGPLIVMVACIKTRERALWSLALLTFVVGDVTTTYIGLNTPGVIEGNAVPAFFIQHFGTLGMIGMKITLVSVMGVWYLALGENEARNGIPIGLALVGTMVTVWNVYILWFAV